MNNANWIEVKYNTFFLDNIPELRSFVAELTLEELNQSEWEYSLDIYDKQDAENILSYGGTFKENTLELAMRYAIINANQIFMLLKDFSDAASHYLTSIK